MSSGYYVEDYEPPHVSIWQRINRLLWALLILTMVAFIIGSFLPELEKQRTEREARNRLHRLIDEQRALHSRYERQIGWLQNDPEYLANPGARQVRHDEGGRDDPAHRTRQGGGRHPGNARSPPPRRGGE